MRQLRGTGLDRQGETTVETELFETGLAARREVMGDAYVDDALAGTTELTKPIQDLVTEYCWGAVWTRPGLPRQTRSLLNVGILTALNRSHELESHIRGAFNNGCSPEEIV